MILVGFGMNCSTCGPDRIRAQVYSQAYDEVVTVNEGPAGALPQHLHHFECDFSTRRGMRKVCHDIRLKFKSKRSYTVFCRPDGFAPDLLPAPV